MKITLFFLIAFNLLAQSHLHETDIAGPFEKRNIEATDLFFPDRTESSDLGRSEVQIEQYLEKNGKLLKVPTMPFRVSGLGTLNENGVLSCQKGKAIRGYYELNNQYFQVYKKRRKNYEAGFREIQCGKKVKLIYEHKSFAGEVMGVWDVVQTAVNKFKNIGAISFWNRPLNVVFPGGGDYFSGNTLNVTKGYQWDVVGHELGHGIYHLARIGVFGGGAHRIDECYTHALALSEGWASYFAAWLKVELDDADAKFEYMVPRRAPLHFENIPTDVCKGEKNEWRVTGFFWDLIDKAIDGETLDEKFLKIWNLSLNQRFRKTSDFKQKLIDSGYDKNQIETIWALNFN